jgi:hypothetical protein
LPNDRFQQAVKRLVLFSYFYVYGWEDKSMKFVFH